MGWCSMGGKNRREVVWEMLYFELVGLARAREEKGGMVKNINCLVVRSYFNDLGNIGDGNRPKDSLVQTYISIYSAKCSRYSAKGERS